MKKDTVMTGDAGWGVNKQRRRSYLGLYYRGVGSIVRRRGDDGRGVPLGRGRGEETKECRDDEERGR